jgi:hypothetical protein
LTEALSASREGERNSDPRRLETGVTSFEKKAATLVYHWSTLLPLPSWVYATHQIPGDVYSANLALTEFR